MTSIIKKIEKVLFIMVLFLLFGSGAQAFEVNNSVNIDESIYKYSALENKISFFDLAKNTDSIIESQKINKSSEDIATKLQEVIIKQNSSRVQVRDVIDTINNKSGLKTFLIGNSLGILKFQLVQMRDQFSVLNTLIQKTEDIAVKVQIENQMKFSEEEQTKVENFILGQESKFSLFRWFVAML